MLTTLAQQQEAAENARKDGERLKAEKEQQESLNKQAITGATPRPSSPPEPQK